MKIYLAVAVYLCAFAFPFGAKAEEDVINPAGEIYNAVQQDEESGASSVKALNNLVNQTIDEAKTNTGKVGAFLKQELERASLHFCAKFLNLNSNKKANLSAGYCYGVQPTAFRNQNFFQRTDSYYTSATTGDLLRVTKGVTTLGMTGSGEGSIQFIRQFTDVLKAYESLPYLPTRLPLKAATFKKLNVNDYASFNTDLNIVWDVSPNLQHGVTEVGASIYYVVSGSFQVNVYKIDDSHVRFKVIGLRGDEGGANFQIGLHKDLKIFGIHVVDKQITRVFDATSLLSVGMSKAKDTTFVADYTIDLNDAAATTAYEQVMKSSWKTQTLQATSQLIKALKETPATLKWFVNAGSGSVNKDLGADLNGTFLNVVSPLDKIFKADQQLHATGSSSRVLRKFEGLVNSDSYSSGYQIGLTKFIYSLIGTQSFYENFIQLQDADSNTSNYIFDISKDTFSKKVLFTLRDTSENSDLHALYKTDANNSVRVFEGLGLTYEYQAKAMDVKKEIEVYTKLKQLLPPDALALLNFDKWNFSTDKSNARIYEQIIFKAAALQKIAATYSQPAQVKTQLTALLKRMDANGNLPNVTVKNDGGSLKAGYKVSDYESDVEEISVRLLKAVSNYESGEAKRYAFKALVTEMPLFKEVAVPLMLELLPSARIQELVYIDVSWSADGGQFAGLTKPIGTSPQGAVYDSMKYILALLNKSNFDLNTYLGENELSKSGN